MRVAHRFILAGSLLLGLSLLPWSVSQASTQLAMVGNPQQSLLINNRHFNHYPRYRHFQRHSYYPRYRLFKPRYHRVRYYHPGYGYNRAYHRFRYPGRFYQVYQARRYLIRCRPVRHIFWQHGKRYFRYVNRCYRVYR